MDIPPRLIFAGRISTGHGAFKSNERMIDGAVEGDRMGLAARRDRDTVKFAYPAAMLVAEKPAS